MRVPLAQSTTRAAARASACSGSRVSQLGRQPCQPRAEREHLDAATASDDRVQVEQQRARVGLHRARHVAQHDELARGLGPAAKAPRDGVAARGDRGARQPAHVEDAPAPVRAQAVRAPRGPVRRHLGDQRPRGGELRGRHRREVLEAQHLVRAVADAVGIALGRRRLAVGVAAHAPGALAQLPRVGLTPGRAAPGAPQEPGVERAVERLEVLAARDERRAQRPVDVLLARDVDVVEAAQRVGDPARPDLQPGLAQHAAERDDVAGEGLAHPVAAAAAARASSTSAATVSSRSISKSS